MPIYEYICQECKEQFSLLQSLYPKDRTTECPRCSSTNVTKAISSFSCSNSSEGSMSSPPMPRFGGGGG